MLSPHIYVALVHERHQTFLAQAETDRRKRRARPRRQRRGAGAAATGRPVVLRDGSAVLIRPVRSADADGSPVPQAAQDSALALAQAIEPGRAVPMSEGVYAILQPWAIRNQGEAGS
jgi:hypothetical protein